MEITERIVIEVMYKYNLKQTEYILKHGGESFGQIHFYWLKEALEAVFDHIEDNLEKVDKAFCLQVELDELVGQILISKDLDSLKEVTRMNFPEKVEPEDARDAKWNKCKKEILDAAKEAGYKRAYNDYLDLNDVPQNLNRIKPNTVKPKPLTDQEFDNMVREDRKKQVKPEKKALCECNLKIDGVCGDVCFVCVHGNVGLKTPDVKPEKKAPVPPDCFIRGVEEAAKQREKDWANIYKIVGNVYSGLKEPEKKAYSAKENSELTLIEHAVKHERNLDVLTPTEIIDLISEYLDEQCG